MDVRKKKLSEKLENEDNIKKKLRKKSNIKQNRKIKKLKQEIKIK